VQFQEVEEDKERQGDMQMKEKLLKRLGFRIECKSFTFNEKMDSISLSEFV